MTKQNAISIFGNPTGLAAALRISRHAVYQWPDALSYRLTNEIIGAAVRDGKPVPKHLYSKSAA